MKNDENTLKIVVETECIGELGPSNTLLRANGSVDNLFLHRRRERFTLTAYWNCNLAVSMTIGTTSSMAILSHVAQCDAFESIHAIRLQVWRLKIRAEEEIAIYFCADSLKYELTVRYQQGKGRLAI